MGLLNAQQSDQQPDAQQPAQPAQQGGDEETYIRLGLAFMKILYGKPTSDHVLEMLKAGADRPVDAVAQAAFAVIKRMQNEIKGINPELAFSIAPALIALIFEMGMTAGIFKETAFGKDANPQKIIGETLQALAQMAKTQQPAPQQAPQQPMQQPTQQPIPAGV